MSSLPSAWLKPKEEQRLMKGHRWAYRNEFARLPKLMDGTLVEVMSHDGKLVGNGFYQEEGGIGVRLLSRGAVSVDGAFWHERLERARLFREESFPGSDVYRWIFGESDGLPGLVIDRYGALAMAQTSCGFYALHAEALIEAVLATPGVETLVFERPGQSAVYGVAREGVDFVVEGMKLRLPLSGNQKTGLFLDQRSNRVALERWCAGKRVLDGHCHHGLWSLHAARGGAASVLAVDTSADAVARAQRNAEVNGLAERCRFEARPIEDALAEQVQYDVVIIDPPAYAKSRTHVPNAQKRYRQLNAAAIQRVAPGGLLVSCSCSHFIDPANFVELIRQAAASAQRDVWLVEMRGAAVDHPVLLGMPETDYLKCAVLRVL